MGENTSRPPEPPPGAAAATQVPDRLWRVPIYLPYLQPALTAGAVEHAEGKLGVRLPCAYLAALRVQNGGYLRLEVHPGGGIDYIAGIGPRFPSLLQHSWADTKEYMRTEEIATPIGIDDLIPFCGDGHYYYCLDYRESGRGGEPRITYVDVECFDVDRVVAPDFATFLSQLRPEPEDLRYGLVTHSGPTDVAAAISKATGFTFEDLGDQYNGYRQFRATLAGEHQFAWLTANRTPRGFVRKDDPEYKVLREQLTELVDRYPEHSDCGYFLSCSDFDSRAGRAITRSLAKLPFITRALPADT
jgi:hypothetical protein